jgi:homoserine dehydrogenase
MPTHNVGIAGLGVIGGGVAAILEKNRAEIKRRTGADIAVVAAAEKDRAKAAETKLSSGKVVADAKMLLDDASVQTVVEVIGGTGYAREFVLAAIDAGKNVVTANKALLAAHWKEIVEAARRKDVSLGFEASAAGGIPVIRTLREAYAGDNIRRIVGILNGTSNYVLSRMTSEGCTFQAALSAAQQKGYAEADPTLDVSGTDSAHKIVILARLAFGEDFRIEDVYYEGLAGIDQLDMKYALELGYRIKLLALAKAGESSVELRVHPCLVKESHPLAHVDGAFNSVTLVGAYAGETMLYGMGAGRWPTASAVVADLIDVATGRSKTVGLREGGGRLAVRPMDDVTARYYIRFQAIDKPGVLAKISGVLGAQEISIASAIQRERRHGQSVPVVIMTYPSREGAVQQSLSEIARLDVITGKAVLLREEE